MMNILQLQDQLKGLSQEQLIREMQMPSGSAPQYLVLSEITRRKKMQDSMAAEQQRGPQQTVAQEAVAAAGVPQAGLGQMAQAMAPQTDMVQNTGIGQLMPPGMPQGAPVQGMAEGGRIEDYGRIPRGISEEDSALQALIDFLNPVENAKQAYADYQAGDYPGAVINAGSIVPMGKGIFTPAKLAAPSVYDYLFPEEEPLRATPARPMAEGGYVQKMQSGGEIVIRNGRQYEVLPNGAVVDPATGQPTFLPPETMVPQAGDDGSIDLAAFSRGAAADYIRNQRARPGDYQAEANLERLADAGRTWGQRNIGDPLRSFFQPIGDAARDVGQPIGDYLEEVGQPIGAGAPRFILGDIPAQPAPVDPAAGFSTVPDAFTAYDPASAAIAGDPLMAAAGSPGMMLEPEALDRLRLETAKDADMSLPEPTAFVRLPSFSGRSGYGGDPNLGPSSLPSMDDISRAMRGTVNIGPAGEISFAMPPSAEALAGAEATRAATEAAAAGATETPTETPTETLTETPDEPKKLAGPGGGAGGAGGAAVSGMSSYEQELADALARADKRATQDKWLALAQAGLEIMNAGARQGTFAGAVGEGGAKGLAAFRQGRDEAEATRLGLLKELEGSRLARMQLAARGGGGGGRMREVPTALITATADELEATARELEALGPVPDGFMGFGGGDSPEVAERRLALRGRLGELEESLAFMMFTQGAPYVPKYTAVGGGGIDLADR
jgi:hypothetical protein